MIGAGIATAAQSDITRGSVTFLYNCTALGARRPVFDSGIFTSGKIQEFEI
jgi:hypothetical protein